MVEVSCAAIIRKIMWFTMSSSVKRFPSASVASHSREKRSCEGLARFFGMRVRMNLSST
jgi:hypothetical protein